MAREAQTIRSCVLLSLLACGGTAAQTPPATTLRQPRPVPGIEDPYPWSPPASPEAMAVLRDRVVYLAGRDLWASDGTTAGTRLLATLCHPYCSSEIVALGHSDDLAFFAQRSPSYDFTWVRVVRTDGTPAGTFAVTGTFPVTFYNQLVCPAARMAGERLYFSRFTRSNNDICELWSSDGTVTGTALLDPEVAVEGDLVPLGDEVYFFGTGHATRGLWRASAEAGRLELVRALPSGTSRLTAVGSRLFFFGPASGTATSRELWTSDGTASGTLPLTRFAVASDEQALLAGLGGRAWFVADDGHGEELWSSDGSVAGTRPATAFPEPHPFQAVPLTADKLAWLGRRLVFPALHRGQPRLWSTDGNRSGAQPVGCRGGCPVVAPLPLAVLGRRAVFVGMSHGAPAELWGTDGSGPGTRQLRSATGFAGLTAAGGGALFVERRPGGVFVGVTDGTPAGTAGRLAAADPARKDLAAAVAALGGRLFFPALDAGGSGALWAVQPGDIAAEEVFLPPPHAAQPRDAPYFSFESSLALLGRVGDRALAWRCDEGRGLFAIDSWQATHLLDEDDDDRSCEDLEAVPAGEGALVRTSTESDALGDASVVWATDGTRPGTFSIPVSPWANARALFALEDRAVFVANDGGKTRLWHSDASAAGTATEVEVPQGTRKEDMASDGSSVCFFDRRDDPLGGPAQRQLWCSDGTASGTRTVGPALTHPRLGYIERGLASLAGQVYFCNGLTPPSLFALGDAGLSEIPLEELGIESCYYGITAAAGRIWFQAEGEGRKWLAVSDGTPAGTARLAELPGWGSDPIPLGSAVFFVVDRDAYPHTGRELWRSDGTVSGTRPLLELGPYELAAGPVEAGGRLWFAAIDREHGVELWSTDGTGAGIRLETDLAPGPAWSSPRSLLPIGDKLYFVADDTERSGIWVLDLD